MFQYVVLMSTFALCLTRTSQTMNPPSAADASQNKQSSDLEAGLYHYLIGNYTAVKPSPPSLPIIVNLTFELFQLLGLNGRTEVLFTTGQISMVWQEPRLSWAGTEYDSLDITHIPAGDVWKPVIGLRNSASALVDPNYENLFPVIVTKSGRMIWAPAGAFETSCSLDMSNFPYDSQVCTFAFGNLVHAAKYVNLSFNPPGIELKDLKENKEFRVLGTSAAYVDVEKHDIKMPAVVYRLYIQRRPLYHLISILMPSLALAILSAATFLVPPEAGEKLSLFMTILLAFSVTMLILSDMSPPASKKMPALAIYLATTSGLSALSMFLSMLVMSMYHLDPVSPLPNWLRTICRIGTRCKRTICSNKVRQSQDTPRTVSTEAGVDRGIADTSELASKRQSFSEVQKLDKDDDLVAILGEVKKVTDRMVETDVEEKMRSEWREAARRIERVFFVLFLVAQVWMGLYVIFSGMASQSHKRHRPAE